VFRKRNTSLVIVGGIVFAFLTMGASCGPSPCTRLAKPTPAELAIVQTGAEVEREIDGYECDLINGQWQIERN
jgi:hypothetical protein